MGDFRIRPWGRPEWLLGRWNVQWSLVGCLATEVRSVESIDFLRQFASHVSLIKVIDPLELPGRGQEYYFGRNLEKLTAGGWTGFELVHENLNGSLDRIRNISDEIVARSENVLLDITSFPKRWFFPLLRFLVSDTRVKNLCVAYTRGSGYPDIISENPEPLRVIPSFLSLEERSRHDYAFVGVGFQTNAMRSLFGEDSARSLQLLFPFPPGPPGVQRNWRFAHQIERIVYEDAGFGGRNRSVRHLRLEAVDASQVFDALRVTTHSGTRTSIMAPYGPKPFSLAMCLFALAAEAAGCSDVPVYYAQPQRYLPDYTFSAGLNQNGTTDTCCYSVKYQGRNFYSI